MTSSTQSGYSLTEGLVGETEEGEKDKEYIDYTTKAKEKEEEDSILIQGTKRKEKEENKQLIEEYENDKEDWDETHHIKTMKSNEKEMKKQTLQEPSIEEKKDNDQENVNVQKNTKPTEDFEEIETEEIETEGLDTEEGTDEREYEGKKFEIMLEAEREMKAIGCFHQILTSVMKTPAYYQRPYISHGYRVNYSITNCLKSIFTLHNETWNIWSHLLSFILFMGFLIGTPIFIIIHQTVFIPPELRKSPLFILADIAIFVIYTSAASYCFFSSTCYHLFGAHNQKTYMICYKLDISAISALIGTSYIPALFYGMYCRFIEQSIYIMIICILAVIGMIMPFSILRRYKIFGTIRTAFFLTMVLVAIVPAIHWIVLEIVEVKFSFKSIELMASLFFMLILYGIGFIFWISKIPERLKPGLFDIWFSSHTLWHLFISTATIYWYFISMRLYMQYSTQFCPTR